MQLYPEAAPGQRREELIKLQAGKLYKVVFKTKDYFDTVGRQCFYPWVEVHRPSSRHLSSNTETEELCVQITFEVANPQEHYHIPLLLDAYSYTTYRGS